MRSFVRCEWLFFLCTFRLISTCFIFQTCTGALNIQEHLGLLGLLGPAVIWQTDVNRPWESFGYLWKVRWSPTRTWICPCWNANCNGLLDRGVPGTRSSLPVRSGSPLADHEINEPQRCHPWTSFVSVLCAFCFPAGKHFCCLVAIYSLPFAFLQLQSCTVYSSMQQCMAVSGSVWQYQCTCVVAYCVWQKTVSLSLTAPPLLIICRRLGRSCLSVCHPAQTTSFVLAFGMLWAGPRTLTEICI